MGRNGEDPEPRISFETWTSRLRNDCERENKIFAFNALDDYVLRLLWKQGTEPSVRGVVAGASDHKTRAHQDSASQRLTGAE